MLLNLLALAKLGNVMFLVASHHAGIVQAIAIAHVAT